MTVKIERDANAFIVDIQGDLESLLGWRPEDLIGRPSTDFIHPQDQPSAISAWMPMIDQPGRPVRWRGRYRNAEAGWVWVETVNTNLLGDPNHRCVRTLMHAVEGGELNIEERLRAREELLNRLTDALPVGVVHFDAGGGIITTNARLDTIVGNGGSRTVEELFAMVATEDRERLADAIGATVDRQETVDGLELQLATPRGPIVCSISLRCLTDTDGKVNGAVATVDDVTDRVRMRHELEHRAATDALTGCLSRRAVLGHLDITLAACASTGSGVSVVFVDLDDFKTTNDTIGHAAGDAVLVAVADRMRNAVRAVDRVGRIGGDEFLVVCPDVNSADLARQIGDRVSRAIDNDLDGLSAIPASVGVAHTASCRDTDADTLVASADAAMYEAKRIRRGESRKAEIT